MVHLEYLLVLLEKKAQVPAFISAERPVILLVEFLLPPHSESLKYCKFLKCKKSLHFRGITLPHRYCYTI
jgi:hypothetical protein